MRHTRTAVATAAVIAVVCLPTVAASADPSATPTPRLRALQGIGSPSTQNVLTDLANVILEGSAAVTAKQRTGNISTLTVLDTSAFHVNDYIQITGVSGFDGTALITALTATTITNTRPGADVALTPVTGAATVTRATDYQSVGVAARSAGTATLYVGSIGTISTGDTVTVYGIDATFSGTKTVTSVSGNTFSYASPGADLPATSVSGVVFRGAQKAISSWDAGGSGSFSTRASAACTYTRAEAGGSGNARSRLLESLTPGNARTGCLDFVRSAAARGTLVTTPSLTWIPFATDASSYAVRSDGFVPRSLTLQNVKDVYKCLFPADLANGDPGITPVLPEAGSDSRTFWLGVVGITEAQITAGTYPCLTGAGTAASRAYVSEDDARNLATDEVMPFSIGRYTVQAAGKDSDTRGSSVLGQIDGTLPQASAEAFPISRDLFNIVPTAKLAVAPTSTVFVGSASLVCSNPATIVSNGFVPLTASTTPACGDTSSQS